METPNDTKNIRMNEKSKFYLIGVLIFIGVLFIILATTFGIFIKNYDNQTPQEIYSYFLMIIDRWLLGLMIFGLFPLTFFQWSIRDKKPMDLGVSIFSGIMLFVSLFVFYSGESYFMEKYKQGELSSSRIFCKPTIETRVFNTILTFQGSAPPAMCVPPEFHKNIK